MMPKPSTYYPEPEVSKFIFASKWMAPFWTVVRVYLGWLWLSAGWGKVTDQAWVGSNAGVAVSGFLRGAVNKSVGEGASVSGWYAWLIETVFLPMAPLLSYVVAFGELFIGLALIVGFLTGAAAFFGGLMNVAFLFAGTLSTNPVMFMLATWLVLAWRVAGYYGLDRWVLPKLGAPRGEFDGKAPTAPRSRTASA